MIRTNHIAFALLTLAASAACAATPMLTPGSVGGGAVAQPRPASPAPGAMMQQPRSATPQRAAPGALRGQRMAPNAAPPMNRRAHRRQEHREFRRDRRHDRREFRRDRREDRREFRRERREDR